MLLTLLSFLVAIGILVTVHEYGHYRVAKACGVKVLTFSIGFGKPILQWQRGETCWQIALIPFGGFVRLLGEDDEIELLPGEEARAFNRQHPLRKMAIVAAGPLANLFLAWLLFSLALALGEEALKPVVAGVRIDSLADRAGIAPNDKILRFGSHEILQWDDLRVAALDEAGKTSIFLEVSSSRGSVREVEMDLSGVEGKKLDFHILERLGLSPLPLLNRVAEIESGSPAERAGLQKGDEIIAVNALPVVRWETLQHLISRSSGREISLAIRRGEEERVVALTPRIHESPQGAVGRIGIAPQIDAERWATQKMQLKLSWLESMSRGAQEMRLLTVLTFKFTAAMLSGDMSAKNVSGPVGIAALAGETASMGFAPYLKFLALLSLSLGILNLLPVPVLDGGHLLYHVAELVRGRPVPKAWQEIGQRIGIGLLVGLMMLALYNDINRFIPG
ncbi:regulator of sigma E protease [Formivibrio citricus]|uniref:Zinc metalloprotease n=1 Tax=Formivibrio citricus TaxID=83765 RepID=A0A1I4X9E2_9NEIS|nr:RIP metalloprotease RseP [Formivibrio citricus]SFN22395.1 regulator of sigma E protease [Formivibrio citricus]